MRKVILRMNELEKYKVIKELVDHEGNKNRAALKLNLSIRQINRLIKIYREKGKSGFVHGNRSRKPAKTLDKSFSDNIILLYRNKYQGFNLKHFQEYLAEEENINVSYSFVYTTLMNVGITSPRIRKNTKRRLAKERLEKEHKLENKTEEEIEVIVNHEISLEDSHPRGEKPKYFGEVIEMDGSNHLWFGTRKACLHLAADEATNTIVGAYFDWQETLNGYYHVFKKILENYGIPAKFKTDNRTVFNYLSLNKDKRTSDKDVLTQFGYACKQFGVALETTSVSQAKGLIERDNGTFQDRLVSELRLNNITTIDEANRYLLEVFVPKFNAKFALDCKKFQSVYETSPNSDKINYTLAVLSPRKIDNGNAIKYKNQYYQPYENNILKCFKPKTQCLVINAFNGELLVTIDDKIYELRKLESHKKYSPEFDAMPMPIKEKQKYIPPMTHPWRLTSFKIQMKKAHNQRIYA
ncbi:MAG: ISNCY family transposase [Erysipelotrichaceae bacterium]|nr:ISNCY family transposase [Erysipelotrichaceae bacterium]